MEVFNHVLSVLKFIFDNFQAILALVIALLTSIIGIALLIPGDQPEKALQGVVDFLKQFSKK